MYKLVTVLFRELFRHGKTWPGKTPSLQIRQWMLGEKYRGSFAIDRTKIGRDNWDNFATHEREQAETNHSGRYHGAAAIRNT